MPDRVLRLLRGRLHPSDTSRLLDRFRADVLPATARLPGVGLVAAGVRDDDTDAALVAVSTWRDEASATAVGVDSPSPAFVALSDIATFDAPATYELVLADLDLGGGGSGGAIGLVSVDLPSGAEAAALELIGRQREVLHADGVVRALLVGRHATPDGVQVVAVALWPDRGSAAAFLADRSEGPGIDPRLGSLGRSLRFEMFDAIDPDTPLPPMGAAAVLVLDASRTIVDASRGIERLLGSPPEAFLGRRLDDLLVEAERAALPGRWRTLLADGAETSVVATARADGHVVALRHRSLARVPAPGLEAVLLEPFDRPPVRHPEAVVRHALGDWRRIARTEHRSGRARPQLVTVPRSDTLFARYVQQVCDGFGVPSIRRLQLHLRGIYPQAVVHRRDLAGERGETWYVFRDGRVRGPHAPDGWWRGPAVASGAVDRTGRLVEVDAAAASLYGVAPDELIGRDVRTLGVPGSFDDFALLLRLAFDLQESESVVRVLGPGGDPLDLAFHATLGDGSVRFALAAVEADDVHAIWFAPLCLPPWDDTFIGRVEALCARLAPADPAEVATELGLRLRVEYPLASVRPLGRLTGFGPGTEVLLVDRDGEPGVDDEWWESPDAARVRIVVGRWADANEAAVELLGIGRDELLASPLDRFRLSGDERMLLHDVLYRTGVLHTTSRIERPGGEAVEVEFRAVLLGSTPPTIDLALRPRSVGAPGAEPAPAAAHATTLGVQPA